MAGLNLKSTLGLVGILGASLLTAPVLAEAREANDAKAGANTTPGAMIRCEDHTSESRCEADPECEWWEDPKTGGGECLKATVWP